MDRHAAVTRRKRVHAPAQPFELARLLPAMQLDAKRLPSFVGKLNERRQIEHAVPPEPREERVVIHFR
jgi:hypothetical protein